MKYKRNGHIIEIQKSENVGWIYHLYFNGNYIKTEAGYRSEDIAFYAAVNKINELRGEQNES